MGSQAVIQSSSPRPLMALSHRRAHAHRRPQGPICVCGHLRRMRRSGAVMNSPTQPMKTATTTHYGESQLGAVETLERCLRISSDFVLSPSCSSCSLMTPVMKKEFGAFGTATLEKSKLDLSQKTTKSSPETAIGGGGGDIGKKINHGGGDGGDDGGDDDDYFGDFDEGDEGDEGGLFRRRFALQELFDKNFVDAVLQEWYKTMVDLPAGLRQAYEMGLVSSAQMVGYWSMNARPTTSRFISRGLPQSLSRAFIGRMLSDPAFLYKLLLEQGSTIACSLWFELKNRKERIKQEWDIALLNILTACACNAFVCWSLAPCRSYGTTFRSDLHNSLQKLPNNIFERNYPLREFDTQKRFQSFLYNAAKFFVVGLAAGSAQDIWLKFRPSKKDGSLSEAIPTLRANPLSYGAFFGLYANLRYQLLCGVDRALFNHFDVLGVVVFFSTAFRILNVHFGKVSEIACFGVQTDPVFQSDALLRSSDATVIGSRSSSSSEWFISKNAIVTGLGLLGIKQGNRSDSDIDSTKKIKRKRIVRKKVSTTST